MKAKRFIFLLCVLVLMVNITSASAAPSIPDGLPVNAPWTAQLLVSQDRFTNISTAFVGKNEIPLVSFSSTSSDTIHYRFRGTSTRPGWCGPDNSWACVGYRDPNMDPTTLSNVATERYGADTFGVKWAYQVGGDIRGTTIEFSNDMIIVDSRDEALIQLNKFGGVLIGAPSVQMVGGWFRIAIAVRDNTFPYLYKLVYMHYTGNTPKTSCTDSGSVYDCEVIDSWSGRLITSPSLDIAPDHTVGIAYYYYGSIKYASPQTNPSQSNCGPGGNTWFCQTIIPASAGVTVGQAVKFSFGPTAADRGIVYTVKGATYTFLRHAEFVGSNGNCGLNFGNSQYQWNCTEVIGLGAIAPSWTPSFSIDFDPMGYPVLSYNRTPDTQSPVIHYITYPKARAGLPGFGWVEQYIEGGPVNDVDTGALTDISINSAGYGFAAYLKQDNYQGSLPDLKIAFQVRQVFLPLAVK